jgi:hypothetical protein
LSQTVLTNPFCSDCGEHSTADIHFSTNPDSHPFKGNPLA